MEGLGDSIFTSCQRFQLQPVCRTMLEAAEVALGPVSFTCSHPLAGRTVGDVFLWP